MLEKDKLFSEGDDAKIWQKYCGFLDLTLQEFTEIQEHLLKEQIELVTSTPLGKKLIGNHKPESMDEFRRSVPLTTYEDYRVHFEEQGDNILTGGSHYWAHTSGASGSYKWCPYTERGFLRLAENTLAAFILASARKKGEVRLRENRERVLLNLPSRPYFSGWISFGVNYIFPFHAIPRMEESEKMEFTERIEEGFKMALRSRVDFIGGLASVLVKVSESIGEKSTKMRFSWELLNPLVFPRLCRAWVRSKREDRPMMPRDLWKVKGIICSGMDSSFYKDQINRYWGVTPGDMYAATESGLIAMTSWTKNGLIFTPHSVFIELIPEEEWMKNKEDRSYQPSTVLLSEARAGERYELVITSFYGMPFLRYRIGDLIRIVALEDEKAGIKLPHVEVISRADNIIDIGSFARLDERTIWRAINDSGIKYEDWVVCKNYEEKQPSLELYIELKEDLDSEKVRHLIHGQLKAIDHDYHELEEMLGIRPLTVNLLSHGTMKRYYEEKRKAGADLSHLKPPHITTLDGVIQKLLELSRGIS